MVNLRLYVDVDSILTASHCSRYSPGVMFTSPSFKEITINLVGLCLLAFGSLD